MSRIPDDVIEAIRQAVDITDLVGRYVPLKRSGNSFKGCCPFHDEKTPSFHVWPETSTWKCFGCGKAGNLYGFLMEREGLTFPEAARQLARDAGIALEAESPEAKQRAGHLQRLRELNEWACRFFEAGLRGPKGEPARAYFKRRSVTGETALRFRLGYAAPGWDNLLRAAARADWSEDELDEAGLIIRKQEEGGRRKVYDRFRERVVFPICDPQGRVIAFGARTLGTDEPKYLNSPETPLYTKGHHLYALHLAKQAMMKTGEGAVMEGYTDVIMAHQAGWPVAVAGLGTALTHHQAVRLARHVKKLWLVYDGDAAGQRAAEKAIPEFLGQEVETRVALLEGGKDPADIVIDAGVEGLRAVLDASPDAFEHLLTTAARDHDASSVPGRAAATEAVLEALAGVTDEIRRALYLKRLADAYGVPEEVAGNRLRELARRRAQREARAATQRAPQSAPQSGPQSAPARGGTLGAAGRPRASQHVGSGDEPPLDAYLGAMGEDADGDHGEGAHGPSHRPPAGSRGGGEAEPARQAPTRPIPPVEQMFLEALLGCPGLAAEIPDEGDELLTHPQTAELLGHLLAAFDALDGRTVEPGTLVAGLEAPHLQALAAGLIASAADKPELPRQFADCVARLRLDRDRRAVRERQLSARDEDEELSAFLDTVAFHRRRAAGPRTEP